MTKLSDTQTILLSAAGQRADGSLLPLPTSIRAKGSGKAIDALLKRGFAEERATTDASAARQTENDHHIGVYLTRAGAAAIGVVSKRGRTGAS